MDSSSGDEEHHHRERGACCCYSYVEDCSMDECMVATLALALIVCAIVCRCIGRVQESNACLVGLGVLLLVVLFVRYCWDNGYDDDD